MVTINNRSKTNSLVKISNIKLRRVTDRNNSYNLPFLKKGISNTELEKIKQAWEIYWIGNQDNTRFVWDLMESDFEFALKTWKIRDINSNENNKIWNEASYVITKDGLINNKMNVQEMMDTLTEKTYITNEQYIDIKNVVEKFSHNIQEDDQYGLHEDKECMMFEVWEDWLDWGMTRDMDIIINGFKWKVSPTFFIERVNNPKKPWKAIRYDKNKWWIDHPLIYSMEWF